MPKKNTADELAEKVQKDKALRTRLVSRLTDTLQELGIKREDMTLIPKGDDPGGPISQIVIISASDSKKNTRSVIIW